MNTIPAAPYKGHRFPQEIMSHAVWLYFRFSLSYRDVEELQCVVSSRLAMLNAPCLPSARSASTFAREGIGYEPMSTGGNVCADFGSGTR